MSYLYLQTAEKNSRRKLGEMHVPTDNIKEYIFEILGGQRDTTFV